MTSLVLPLKEMYRQGSSSWSVVKNEEYQEEDIWSVLNDRQGHNSRVRSLQESSSFTSRRLPTAAKMIPRAKRGSCSSNEEPQMAQHSAPISIPDWSKIYGTKMKKGSSIDGDNDDDHNHYGGGFVRSSLDSDEDDESDAQVMPPHEWLARRLERSQISSFSVCEGAGRTLKGRDLSRVRNAVLTKTGFLE